MLECTQCGVKFEKEESPLGYDLSEDQHFCQECWEAYSSECWWAMWADMPGKTCETCQHFQAGFCHLPDWDSEGVQRNSSDVACGAYELTDCDDREPVCNCARSGANASGNSANISDPF